VDGIFDAPIFNWNRYVRTVVLLAIGAAAALTLDGRMHDLFDGLRLPSDPRREIEALQQFGDPQAFLRPLVQFHPQPSADSARSR